MVIFKGFRELKFRRNPIYHKYLRVRDKSAFRSIYNILLIDSGVQMMRSVKRC